MPTKTPPSTALVVVVLNDGSRITREVNRTAKGWFVAGLVELGRDVRPFQAHFSSLVLITPEPHVYHYTAAEIPEILGYET